MPDSANTLTTPRIQGVRFKRLRVIPDERGRLMEVLRADDEEFQRFGQVYVATGYPGVVKAWHLHRQQTDNLAVVSGMAKVVLYDARQGSPTRGIIDEFFMGVHNPALIQIPAGVYHGFKAFGPQEAVVLNLPTRTYDYANPDEERLPPDDPSIPYRWARRDG